MVHRHLLLPRPRSRPSEILLLSRQIHFSRSTTNQQLGRTKHQMEKRPSHGIINRSEILASFLDGMSCNGNVLPLEIPPFLPPSPIFSPFYISSTDDLFLILLLLQQKKVCNGALSTFMPLVIAGFGFSSLNALLLTMPAGAYCGTVVLLAAYLAMKFEHIRTWIIALAQALSTGAAVLLWQLPTSERGWLLFAMYLLPSAAAGYCVLMGLQIANTAGYTKRALASSGIFVGYCKLFFFYLFCFFLCLFVYWTKKKGGIFCSLDTFILHQTYTYFYSNSFVLLLLLSRHRKFRRTLHLSRKRTSQIRHRIRHYLDHGGDFRAPRYCISIRMYTG